MTWYGCSFPFLKSLTCNYFTPLSSLTKCQKLQLWSNTCFSSVYFLVAVQTGSKYFEKMILIFLRVFKSTTVFLWSHLSAIEMKEIIIMDIIDFLHKIILSQPPRRWHILQYFNIIRVATMRSIKLFHVDCLHIVNRYIPPIGIFGAWFPNTTANYDHFF